MVRLGRGPLLSGLPKQGLPVIQLAKESPSGDCFAACHISRRPRSLVPPHTPTKRLVVGGVMETLRLDVATRAHGDGRCEPDIGVLVLGPADSDLHRCPIGLPLLPVRRHSRRVGKAPPHSCVGPLRRAMAPQSPRDAPSARECRSDLTGDPSLPFQSHHQQKRSRSTNTP